jgi:translation initiation factor IF-2
MALGLPRRKPKESKKARKARFKMEARRAAEAETGEEKVRPALPPRQVAVSSVVTVRDFAATLQLPVTQVISMLLKNGVIATINESIDFDTAAIIGDELGFEIVRKGEPSKETVEETAESKILPRPPIVTVMGHVDHGKTLLLDTIRKTNVVAEEAGGITQHIGAYQVEIKDKEKKARKITFLDTPGHEAFSAMRAHGANVTDIVVLVVAADDGVKPQTIEAYTHARAANVPIIVAINKIDLPAANPEKVKRQLSEIGLIPEEWGGKTIMVPLSAKTGQGIETLLEMIALTSDLKKIQARAAGSARGVIIESQLLKGMGPVATVLIQEGVLKIGDIASAGYSWGRIRIIQDDQGRRLKEARPGLPARIAGLSDIPSVGDILMVVPDEKTARARAQKITRISHPTLRLTDLSVVAKGEAAKSMTVVLKADVSGSLDAIKKSLADLVTEDVQISLVHEGIGPIGDSDVNTAAASNALILGFKVPVLPVAQRLAEEKGVKIAVYEVIYKLIEDVVKLLEALLPPEIIEIELGRLEITHLFKQSRAKQIVGGKVTKGTIEKGAAEVLREDKLVGKGEIQSVQIAKSTVPQAKEGSEAGILFVSPLDYAKIKVGDTVIAKGIERRLRHLKKASV